MRKIHRQRLVSAVILSRIDYCNTIQAELEACRCCRCGELWMLLSVLSPISDHVTTSHRRRETSIGFQSGNASTSSLEQWCTRSFMAPHRTTCATRSRQLLTCQVTATHDLLNVDCVIRTRHGSRAFSVTGPIVWNSPPQTIRNTPSACRHFQIAIKTCMFNWIYNAWVKLRHFRISSDCEGPLFNFVRGVALQNILISDYLLGW